jgi:CelD/BcsL family acetyltransferase involved in cellulose biosynthesis
VTVATSAIAAVDDVAGAPLSELALDDPRWISFVSSRLDSTPFHYPAWPKLLAECYGFRAFALATVDQGRIGAGFPVVEIPRVGRPPRWVSLPFTDACAPLADAGAPEDRLVAGANRAVADGLASRVELRGEVTGPTVQRQIVAFRHVLQLSRDPEQLFTTFRKSRVQRGIRQAERLVGEGNLSIRRAEREDDIAGSFYRLHLGTRRRLGVPVQPRRFFRLLWQRILEPGLGFALLASSGGRPIAGAVFLAGGRQCVYKFGASEREAQRLRPNHLLLWTAIREACTSGYEQFDFGRTDLDGHNLREFKLGWGTVEDPLIYSAIGGPAADVRPSRARRTLGRLIRHSPAWICRASGELLYRRAA